MSRLIDADEAITRIDAKLNEIPTFTESEYGIMGYSNACRAFKRMLISLPTVSEWIPCSERPPEWNEHVDDMVLVCYGNGSVRFNAFVDGKWCQGNPIAWMPLPKPYEVKEE